MRKLTRSALRVAIAILVILFVGVVAMRLALTQPGFGKYSYPDGARARPEALEGHVQYLTQDVFPRNHRFPENLNRAAEYIRTAFLDSGAEVLDQTYEVQGTQYRNVIGRLGPSRGAIVVVGAHYDVYGELPGADDNASGTAGLLELARILAARGVSTRVELVAYSTEEPPFFGSSDMGSAVHAASLRSANAEVTAMISLEMIGYFTERQPVPVGALRLLYPRHGNFALVAGRWADRGLIAEIKRSFRGASSVPIKSYCGPTQIGTDLSDHRNYWANDYHAVMVTDTAFVRNPNYHRLGDRSDTLDYGRMAEVVDGVANAVLNLGHADLPAD